MLLHSFFASFTPAPGGDFSKAVKRLHLDYLPMRFSVLQASEYSYFCQEHSNPLLMTPDFKRLENHCRRHRTISDKVLDQFLMNFIAKRERMDQKMKDLEQKYRHIIRKMPREFFPMMMGEYIIGKTLMPDGLIHNHLNNAQIRSLDQIEQEFLEFQVNHPWRYCFARIAGHPATNFFRLSDAFYEDEFLLYSPGMEAFWAEGRKQDLYFLLIGFNGQCWHTYGVILAMKSFSPDDIYFYGTEVFPEVDSDASLMASVYRDPMPYMMLACGMEYPIMMSGDHVLRHWVAVDEIDRFDTEPLTSYFSIRWNNDMYRISQQEWDGPPHFATAYFNEKSGEFTRYAMTEQGFRELTGRLNQLGLPIGPSEDYSVGLSMVITMEEILKRKVPINEYETWFPEEVENPIPQKDLDRMNRFLNLLLPFFNAGTTPDLNRLARQSGIDPEEARSLYDQLKGKFGRG